MTKMGLAAIYPKPKPTGIDKPSKTYPYLLKGLSIIRPNQVWATDITYIRLSNGFVYLVQLWIGFPGMCCLGNFQTHSNTFVYRRLIGHLANRDR